MQILFALFTGLAVGFHNATWGMYKDSPHEGFTWKTYFRSVVVGAFFGPLLWYIFQLDLSSPANLFLLFGVTYSMERVTMEVYKTFIRVEDQNKYFIPMQLSALGKPVKSHGLRLFLGLLYLSVIALVGYGIVILDRQYQAGGLQWPFWLILLACSVCGWISAIGGAWKDAPLEGFETFKFFRSPAVAYFYAFIASLFTGNLVIITMCSIGFTIATIESYKTFFFPNRPRGKFQGKPVLFPEMLQRRQNFVPLYITIWVMVIGSFVVGFISRV